MGVIVLSLYIIDDKKKPMAFKIELLNFKHGEYNVK